MRRDTTNEIMEKSFLLSRIARVKKPFMHLYRGQGIYFCYKTVNSQMHSCNPSGRIFL